MRMGTGGDPSPPSSPRSSSSCSCSCSSSSSCAAFSSRCSYSCLTSFLSSAVGSGGERGPSVSESWGVQCYSKDQCKESAAVMQTSVHANDAAARKNSKKMDDDMSSRELIPHINCTIKKLWGCDNNVDNRAFVIRS